MGFCKKCGAELAEDARFCEKCGTPVEIQGANNQQAKIQAESSARKQSYEGEIRKCPNCGDPIDAFELVCDKCGFNFSTNRMSTSQERLAAQLAVIDGKMQEAKKRAKKDDYHWAAPFKEQKATCINSFPVANSVEEIVSFMMYACGNIDMTCVATSNQNNTYDKGDHMIADAWIGKMDQMYQMAKISFSDSPKFAQIENLYNEKKEEIKKTGIKRVLSNPFTLLIGMMIIPFALLGIWGLSDDKEAEEREQEKARMEAMGMVSVGWHGDYEKQNIDLVVSQFEEMGFTNIETIDLDDAGFRKKENTVETVSVKGITDFSSSDYFDINDRVVITYH